MRIARYNPLRSSLEQKIPIVTALTCSWCIAVYLSLLFRHATGEVSVPALGYFTIGDVTKGAFWGPLTNSFVHFDLIHIAFNLYWTWLLGGAMERAFGPLRMLLFVLVAGLISGNLEMFSGQGGVGLSGIGYALFGFTYLTRSRFREFWAVSNDRTAQMFIVWGLFCVVATYMKWLNIGNIAHASGLAFGACLGALFMQPAKRWWLAVVLVAMGAAACIPFRYNPKSVDWLAEQAKAAEARSDDAAAERFYFQAMDQGARPQWGWWHLTDLYARRWKSGDRAAGASYRTALERLQAIEPDGAQEIVQYYGPPPKP